MQLRRARVGDEWAVAEVHVRSWQVGYRGLIADDHLDGLRPEDRAAHYTFDGDDPLTIGGTFDRRSIVPVAAAPRRVTASAEATGQTTSV